MMRIGLLSSCMDDVLRSWLCEHHQCVAIAAHAIGAACAAAATGPASGRSTASARSSKSSGSRHALAGEVRLQGARDPACYCIINCLQAHASSGSCAASAINSHNLCSGADSSAETGVMSVKSQDTLNVHKLMLIRSIWLQAVILLLFFNDVSTASL